MQEIAKKLKGHPLAVYKDFRRLFFGRVVSAVGDKFFSIAVAWWALNASGGGKLQLGLLMGATFLPVVLFSPFLGALVDRSDKRMAMLWADAARGGLVLCLGALAWRGALEIWQLFAFCFMIAGFAPMFESAVSSSLLRLTSEEHLPAATAADSSVVQLSGVFGSALGSVFMAALGAAGAFFFNSLTYALSFAAVWLIGVNLKPERLAPTLYMDELKAGLRYLGGNKPLLYLLLAFAGINFFVGPLLVLIPMIVKYTLQASVKWLALLETCFALGSALAALALSFRTDYARPYVWIFGAVLGLGLPFLGLYFTADRWAVCALLFCCGAALGAGNAVVLGLFQRVVPDEMKGRFFSVVFTLCNSLLPLSFMATGLLAEKFSVGFCIALNSIATLLLSGIVLKLPRAGEAS